MSGWTIITLRAREGQDYEHSKYDDSDPWCATADIVATMDSDDRVHEWTTWNSHVYAYLNCDRYNFEFAESFMEDYGHMIQDAVVLGANDTSDQGTSRYYPRPDLQQWTDQYEEYEYGNVGEQALGVMASRHGIIARDPFHNQCGLLDEQYAEDGTARQSEQ